MTGFLLPCLMLLEADMIFHLSDILRSIPAQFLVGFAQSFVTLIRSHQIMFLHSAAGTTDGQLLASWMADIFFAPVSIITPEQT